MANHIRRTTDTYDSVAPNYLENTRSGGFEDEWLHSFADGLPDNARVLDLGSGPGRDATDLRRLKLNPICLDRSLGMLRAGLAEYPNQRILGDMLSLPVASSAFSGVWANASLLHLTPGEVAQGLKEISRVLVRGGKLHISLKEGVGSHWESERYGKPRWFQFWSSSDLDTLLDSAKFRIAKSAREETTRNTWLVRQCVAD